MNISAIGNSYQPVRPMFKSDKYENPVNRGTERNLAILASVGISALTGAVAGGLSTLFPRIKDTGWKGPVGIGALAGLLVLGLTLPQKLYSTKVNAYARQKEMDVFSRQKSAQSSIYEDINDEIQDKNVSLDNKINHYATVKMADNGSGVMVKGV